MKLYPNRLKNRALEEVDSPPPESNYSACLGIRNAVKRFLDYIVLMKRVSSHTVRNYTIDLESLIVFISKEEEVPLSLMTKQKLRQFIAFECHRKLSRRSLARKVSSLRSFTSFCLREKILIQDPMEEIESPKLDKTIPVFLSYNQVERFLRLPDVSKLLGLRDRAIMELFYSSGIRLSELSGLNRIDVDFSELMLTIRGKGKKERLIPITVNASEWILKYLQNPDRRGEKIEGKDPVFLNCNGGRLSCRSIDRIFARYLLEGGFSDRITPHVIRHTIATHWLEAGMDLKTIQALLGHSSMAATTIYTKVSTSLKKKVVSKLHPRFD